MKPVLDNIKKNSDEIRKDAYTNKSSSAVKLIDAFWNYNNNCCKITELHLKACYNKWKSEFFGESDGKK